MIKTLLRSHPAAWRFARRARQKMGGRVEREVELLKHLVTPGRLVVDVGGNTGAYCEELIRLTPRVITIEANPQYAKQLDWMFEGKVKVINAAASDQAGEVHLRVPDDPSLGGLATVAANNPLQTSRSISVPAIALDSLNLSDVSFVKIDVEGHELAVLHGARDLIERERPNLLIEAEERHCEGALEKVYAFLKPFGYAGYMLREGVLTSISSFDPAIHQSLKGTTAAELDQGHVPEGYANNFVFLPN